MVIEVFFNTSSKDELSIFSFFETRALGKGMNCSFPSLFNSSFSGIISLSSNLSSTLSLLFSISLVLISSEFDKILPLLRAEIALMVVPFMLRL